MPSLLGGSLSLRGVVFPPLITFVAKQSSPVRPIHSNAGFFVSARAVFLIKPRLLNTFAMS